MGVICDQYAAVPRAMLEYMAADVPVLVNAEMRAGSRYIGPKAGLVRPPAEFHRGILDILANREEFRPREHLLEHYSRDQVVKTFLSIVDELVHDNTK
jgi:glycosyltransferase involved in cell wall biosynthesis